MYDDLSRPPLNQSDLTRALTRNGSRWRSVDVLEAVPSTNAVLAQRIRDGALEERVVVAELQTAGRGRFDRVWTSPSRAGITMSVLVRPAADVPVARWPWITLIAGLAVAAAVNQLAEVPATLKWPNDVIVDDKKLAGLLAERIEGPAGAAVVVGVGLNVTTTSEELPIPEATSLRLQGAAMTDRSTLVKAILRRLEGLLSEWESGRGTPSPSLRSAYENACISIGRQLTVLQPGAAPVTGEGVGIDESGRLLVQTESGQQAFGAGDVVHVRSPG
jgi:BirA family biotin operon repressor/biotin-[acetyl-CoA-carboxylase] ligase